MEPSAAIWLAGVSKSYGTGAGAVPALDRISFRVEPGEFVSVVGRSGAGKSTLLSVIAGVEDPSAGRIVVDGHDLARLSDDARSDLRLRRIGLVFQTGNLFPTFTARENVAWPLVFLRVGWREARARAAAVLAEMGLDPRAYARRPAELSGGEQQRVAMARALVTEPRLLLADEPTGNLDSTSAQTILDLLAYLNVERQLTLVLVTHDLLAACYADRRITLRDGRIVRESPERPAIRCVPR